MTITKDRKRWKPLTFFKFATIEVKGLDVKQSVFTVPMNGWDKPVYMEYEGALRAFKFIMILFETDNVDENFDIEKIRKSEFVLKIAGVDKNVYVYSDDNGYFPHEYALTVEDYLNGSYDYNTASVTPDVWLKQCLNTGFTSTRITRNYETVWKAVRYRWNGVRAVEAPISICSTIAYDYGKGFHFFTPLNLIEVPKDTYPSKEACEDDNNVTVIEFKAGELD